MTDHLKQRSRAARLLCKATKTDHIINLSQKHRSISEAYCLHRLFLPAAFASNICYFCNWTWRTEQCWPFFNYTSVVLQGGNRKREKTLLSLCFCVEMWRRYLDDSEGWGGGGEWGGQALEASTHEQLVFQVLMVLNTKRPQQIPTAEVSDGKWRKSAPWQGVIYILASFHYLNESIISQCNINSRKSTH